MEELKLTAKEAHSIALKNCKNFQSLLDKINERAGKGYFSMIVSSLSEEYIMELTALGYNVGKKTNFLSGDVIFDISW